MLATVWRTRETNVNQYSNNNEKKPKEIKNQIWNQSQSIDWACGFSIQNYKIAIINDYKRFLYTLLEIDKRLLTIL